MNKVQKNIGLVVKKSISVRDLKIIPVFQGKGISQKAGNCTGCGSNVALGLKLAIGM
ncbi:hypothetical protein I3256_02805 [Photobacterium damselae]|uniref:hypothetical protein n=1 Tax=Photobacterium damselae TaxID=38293 RepID=UPI001EE07492|nr:hypothetical protein [Photobacterium damselae]MCG3814855.1 hypothetical protein [Photobacterium damselae]